MDLLDISVAQAFSFPEEVGPAVLTAKDSCVGPLVQRGADECNFRDAHPANAWDGGRLNYTILIRPVPERAKIQERVLMARRVVTGSGNCTRLHIGFCFALQIGFRFSLHIGLRLGLHIGFRFGFHSGLRFLPFGLAGRLRLRVQEVPT